MVAVPRKVGERLSAGLKRYQPVLAAAQSRDLNESDTSMIVSDMLADVFGYDKYTEVTRELCIRGTFCDLALRIDDKFQLLVEVKAVGTELRDLHVKQVVDYAANQGIEWVALTSGVIWRVYRVSFGKPIDKELVLDIDLLSLNPRSEDHVAELFLLTRESILKSALDVYHDQRQAMSKFFLAAVILGDTVMEVIRRELRRLSPDLRVELEVLKAAVAQDVLKRDVIEGEQADHARRKVQRAAGRMLRTRKEEEGGTEPEKESRSPQTAGDKGPSE